MERDSYRLAGIVLDGKFRVDDLVAQGGFGSIYRGFHLSLQGPVAVKVLSLPPNIQEAHARLVSEMFVREAQTIARFDHPNIVKPMDLGISRMPNGAVAPWMVLHWLEGQTLRDWIAVRANTRFSPGAALRLLRPLFSAVAYAHARGVAHRDLKPSNVMVAESGGEFHLRLMDFGIAKLMEDGVSAGQGGTKTGSEFTTYSPAYGSPEQAKGLRTGPWTDVHALALILGELLIGAPCYREREPLSLLRETVLDPRPTPRRYGVDVGAWEPVLARALHLQPAQRFANAAEFLATLEHALATGPRISSIGDEETELADLGTPAAMHADPRTVPDRNAPVRAQHSPTPYPSTPSTPFAYTGSRKDPSTVDPQFRLRPTLTSAGPRRATSRAAWIAGGLACAVLVGGGFIALVRRATPAHEQSALRTATTVSTPIAIVPALQTPSLPPARVVVAPADVIDRNAQPIAAEHVTPVAAPSEPSISPENSANREAQDTHHEPAPTHAAHSRTSHSGSNQEHDSTSRTEPANHEGPDAEFLVR